MTDAKGATINTVASVFPEAIVKKNESLLNIRIETLSLRPMKNLFTLFLVLLCLSGLHAQSFKVSGKVADETDGSALAGAAVKLILLTDSTKFRGTIAENNGNFLFEMVRKGSYMLKVSFVGYSTAGQKVDVKNEDRYLGTINLGVDAKNLKDVEIAATQIRVQQKDDTTEFNAAAFKTNPDATAEDLVKKMPGITSDNGVLKSNGEEVRRVTVDGKSFFGDDAQMALKNLPSDAVDRVQVFDALSDQGAFSSFDDGNSQKQMNIVTKKGMKNGVFGKVYGGYGYLTDSRYNAGATINWFDGNRRVSLLAMSNNVNEQNFSMQDLIGATGGGGNSGMGRMMRMAGSAGQAGNREMNRMMQNSAAGNFFVGNSGGISTTHSVGINYVDILGKNVRFSGSYFFNISDNVTDKELSRQYFNAGDSSAYYREKNLTNTRNMNHRVNLKVEYYIDSMNSVIITPRFSIQDNRQNNSIDGLNTIAQSEFLSSTSSDFSARNIGYNLSTDVFYAHKFRKQWRTFSVNFNAAVNNKDGNSEQQSSNVFAGEMDSVALDQQYNNTNRSYTLSGNLSYTEPVGENGILLLSYTPSFNNNFSDKETFNKDTSTLDYTLKDISLSNRFGNIYMTQRGGANFKWRQDKWVLTVGANVQYALLNGSQQFPFAFKLSRTFIDMLPTATFQYKVSENNNLRLNYRTSTNAPSIAQLQTVVDNSNPLLLNTGNADLKQSYNHNFFGRYSFNELKKQQSFFAFVSFNYQANYIANSTVIAAKDSIVNGVLMRAGSQLSAPVNMNGYINSNLFMNYSFPLLKIKCNMNITGGAGYTRTPGIINGFKNLSNNINSTFGVNLSSNISEKIDFNIGYNGNYTVIKNSLQTNTDNNFFSHSASAKFNWMFWKGFVFNTSLTNSFYYGLGDGFNQNIFLWNAALGYKFLKDRSLEVRFSVNDILNQNNGVSRNVMETYVEDNRTVVLRRYCLLTITYNLRFFKDPEQNKR